MLWDCGRPSRISFISSCKWNARLMVNFGTILSSMALLESPFSSTSPPTLSRLSIPCTISTISCIETLSRKIFCSMISSKSSWLTLERLRIFPDLISKAQEMAWRAENHLNTMLEHLITWLQSASTTRHRIRYLMYILWVVSFTIWRQEMLRSLVDLSTSFSQNHWRMRCFYALNCSARCSET